MFSQSWQIQTRDFQPWNVGQRVDRHDLAMDDTTRGKVRRVLALAKDPAIEAAEMLLDKPDPHYLVTRDAADQGRLGLDPGDTLV
ncbi:MAG TPA: hypothetical protein VK281_11995, partial [Xanthobacteraceae bacterium]|nr:hypothetical protein [Xanthobacteraceae bacterium]